MRLSCYPKTNVRGSVSFMNVGILFVTIVGTGLPVYERIVFPDYCRIEGHSEKRVRKVNVRVLVETGSRR